MGLTKGRADFRSPKRTEYGLYFANVASSLLYTCHGITVSLFAFFSFFAFFAIFFLSETC